MHEDVIEPSFPRKREPIRRSKSETSSANCLFDKSRARQPTQGLWVPAFAGTTRNQLFARSPATAALIKATPSSLDHSAGPAIVPISQPLASIRTEVGMPMARPIAFNS
jgi:hypothetical protein